MELAPEFWSLRDNAAPPINLSGHGVFCELPLFGLLAKGRRDDSPLEVATVATMSVKPSDFRDRSRNKSRNIQAEVATK